MINQDDKEIAARVADMVKLSLKRGLVFSRFLNERQQSLAGSELKRLRCENYLFFGGVENAQRRMLCVYNEYFRPENEEFPISCITLRYRTACRLSHRDVLGAFMSLNISRETVGDILIGDGMAQIFVTDAVKNTAADEIIKIGSVGVTVSADEPVQLSESISCRPIKGTVASLRLDCVLSLALGLSRGKTADVITAGRTEVNYTSALEPAFIISQGDIISVRGYGKFRLEEASGVSKKGRIHIVVLKYC